MTLYGCIRSAMGTTKDDFEIRITLKSVIPTVVRKQRAAKLPRDRAKCHEISKFLSHTHGLEFVKSFGFTVLVSTLIRYI